MYVYIYIYIYTYIYVYIYICIHICIYILYIFICIDICLYMYVYSYTHIYICICVWRRALFTEPKARGNTQKITDQAYFAQWIQHASTKSIADQLFLCVPRILQPSGKSMLPQQLSLISAMKTRLRLS